MANKVIDVFVSVVFVVDTEASDVTPSVKRLTLALKRKYANYEVIVVDNGLSFEQHKSLISILESVACIRIIQLSKIVEVDTAVFAGLEAAIGDRVCVLYNNDPVERVPNIIDSLNSEIDIIFGVAKNLRRKNIVEQIGAEVFYWYNRRFLKISIPNGATYFICMNRSALNALTRNGRYSKHLRYLTKQIGFKSKDYHYELPKGKEIYAVPKKGLFLRAISLISSYSNHPLRAVTYFGLFAGIMNMIYAGYVVVINLSESSIAQGWTTLSLQASLMFFCLFMIMALLSEYIGQILEEARGEPPYYIQHELSSTISIADETRRNITK